MARFRVVLAPAAAATAKALPRDVKRAVREALAAIALDPYLGKELLRELDGLRSHRARRYRIVYALETSAREVRVVAIGRRESIYEDLAHERLQRRRAEGEPAAGPRAPRRAR